MSGVGLLRDFPSPGFSPPATGMRNDTLFLGLTWLYSNEIGCDGIWGFLPISGDAF